MGFAEDLHRGIAKYAEKMKQSVLAKKCGINQTSLNRFLKHQRGIGLSLVGRLVDGVGGRIVFPCDEQVDPVTRDVLDEESVMRVLRGKARLFTGEDVDIVFCGVTMDENEEWIMARAKIRRNCEDDEQEPE